MHEKGLIVFSNKNNPEPQGIKETSKLNPKLHNASSNFL